ncbi:pyridine nucleotide-disulfide oxidoreductase domain-containing protein 2 isoform X1 [Polypterus senegalus]|uniref:pyridine nucleotide-disulfide oxidoreductase domain-containing protein 2 isoform X1 n=1 Tax=Polypterus senegalus TaxID=55291 RepID=UPI0019661608|nr:pyridine nucleotide-disulfide oxidoreductase domain-containing protein 2 isoform X1 [Polypterus senegalus]
MAGVWCCRAEKAFVVCSTTLARGNHSTAPKLEYDAVIIGAGHNGLVAAAYLQKAGINTAVLERRKVIGGAAVTEEIVPGFKFSRASYLLSLLRPQIYKDLELKKHGLKVYLRNPHSFTPLLEEGTAAHPPRSLLLGDDMAENQHQISVFSKKDAKAYPLYQTHMEKIANAIEPLLDAPPVNIAGIFSGALKEKLVALRTFMPLLQTGRRLGKSIPDFYELLTAPTTKILNRWFDSEPLKATLATDSLIGAMLTPSTPGSGYVLLHHVMGEIEGTKGAWGYAEGGMGGVSKAIANSAQAHGASIFTEKAVQQILVNDDGRVKGVLLKDGTEVHSKVVLSNATPHVTFRELTPQNFLPPEFTKAVSQIDYCSPVTKINVAVDKLPNFRAVPNCPKEKPGPHHQCSIHLNCENIDVLEKAYQDVTKNLPSGRPVIEMCIPSSLDPTLAPPGCHVISLFTQYTPYLLHGERHWTEEDRNAYADTVFDSIEQYAPGFKRSVVGREVLTPQDLESIFGLTGGNIFHGAMSLDQLYFSRPLTLYSNYRSPVKGLYLCGSGSHPGGGVMGSSGRNAACTVISDFKKSKK